MARGGKKQFEAVERLRVAAEAGEPAAMWDYAILRLNLRPPSAGAGENALPFLVRVKDTVNTFGDHQLSDLIQRAAAAGHIQAMVVAAALAEPTDPEATERLLTQAANAGDTAAMLYLGAMLEGHDQAGAVRWFTRLAESGDPAGMYRLARLLTADGDQEAARGWLVRAAQAGNLKAQSELGVQAIESGARPDPGRPPASDPRRSGVFTSNTPTTRKERLAADCVKCATRTVQDHYELIVGKYFGLRGSGTTGKAGHRVNFRACTVCGCLFPMDDESRQYVNSKGGEFFNPAKLAR